ncbi:MAG: phage portal protein [Planctomycetaceae bacterium]|nr:phage portal protein [Planctomycetaceae bacterium]
MTALTRAFAASQRSLLACKTAVSTLQTQYRQPNIAGVSQRQDLSRAHNQLQHFNGWVYAAIRAIAQKIAGQPIRVGKKAGRVAGTKHLEGTRNRQPTNVTELESHPLLDLLADPNDLMVGWSLIYVTVASIQLTGRALWWLPDGQDQILPIPVSWLRGFEGVTQITAFNISPPHSGETFAIPAEQCVYFALPDPADPHGAVSPLFANALAVDADESIQTSQAVAFRRGIHPTHAIIVGKNPTADGGPGVRPRLSQAQQRQIIEAIQKRYASPDKAGEPVILDGLIEDIKALSHSPAEMNWLESSQLTKERILQGFGVSETVIGAKDATRASSYTSEKHFVDHTINPLIELMNQTLTEWLSPMYGGEVVVWIEKCVANDDDMQLKWAQMLAKHESITGDELRELSPFALPVGDYSATVSGGGQTAEVKARAEARIADAFEKMAKAMQDVHTLEEQAIQHDVKRVLDGPHARLTYDETNG